MGAACCDRGELQEPHERSHGLPTPNEHVNTLCCLRRGTLDGKPEECRRALQHRSAGDARVLPYATAMAL